ncbi:MAG: DNA polymerase III subunit gamma/tau, partial [Luteimonas sp.]
QAIAYTGSNSEGGRLEDAAVATMLGTVDRSRVGALLAALGAGEGAALLAEVAMLAEFSPDWNGVLDALADALHRVQVKQLVPAADVKAGGVDIDALAAQLRPELVQLWYQMALNARRDLSLAPSPRAGFEMAMLRMLAFRPAEAGTQTIAPGSTVPRVSGATAAKAALSGEVAQARAARPAAPSRSTPAPAPRIVEPAVGSLAAAAPIDAGIDADRWLELVANCGLKGPAKELAGHAGFVGFERGVLRLSLTPGDEHLKAPSLVRMLGEALVPALGAVPQIRFETAATSAETLHQRSARERDARQVAAENAFMDDPGVQRLINQYGATLVPDSIRPFDE